MQKFKFKKFGRVFLPIYFKPFGAFEMKSILYKVDTGADVTTISKLDIYALGYDEKWISGNIVSRGSATTATGDYVETALLRIPLLNVLGYEAKNWLFSIVLEDGKDFRNLLGRDLLAGFDYTFRNSLNVFEIERTSKFVAIYPLEYGQEIHEVL